MHLPRSICFMVVAQLCCLIQLGAGASLSTIDDETTASFSFTMPISNITSAETLSSSVDFTSMFNMGANQSLISVTPSGRVLLQGRVSNTTYPNTTPSSDLSGGAIAGIVIGIIVLICCCCCCIGGSAKSGHWENAKVWVPH